MTSRGLLILIALLLIILLLFVVIVVLAAMWPRSRAQEAPKVCDTPACLRAAAQVISREKIMPCPVPIVRRPGNARVLHERLLFSRLVSLY